jgi:RNA polymerase sigma-70 factor, ECF subfamily
MDDRVFPSTLQVTSPPLVLPKKFLNKPACRAVFIIEGKRLLLGETVLSEAVTVQRSQDRSQDQTLEDLVREHSRLVYRIAYAALRSHHDAEDATQETFLRVLRYRHRLAAVDEPKTWLARITWRVAVERSRRRARNQEVPLDDHEKPVAETTSPDLPADDLLQGSQIGELLNRLIAALPEKLRAPLLLSTLEEMSPRDVAAALGINEAAARSRVFRARQILKAKLADRLHGK